MKEILDCKNHSEKILSELQRQIKKAHVTPSLAIILAGEDPASKIYVTRKKTVALEIGAKAEVFEYPSGVDQRIIEEKIKDLNKNKEIHGIMIQLPLPKNFDTKKLTQLIAKGKDVDGLRSWREGTATSDAVMEILRAAKVPLKNRIAVVVGRSRLVGKPVAYFLRKGGARVFVCHSKTPDLASKTKKADILVSAVGKPHLIRENMVKEGAVVVDVGEAKVQGKIVGDVDYEIVKNKASFVTPVPGGVGPTTVALLLQRLTEKALSGNF
ncbi:MAG: hypothetical protein A2Y57_00120 [Candidatus Woykebacteria bacterium RBG_13_40_7b]|uniref:Bifunctional protein FolD n=1 Tax=Candidatus Woykebacteria bacterium RBG_13_40_7b TaxID=1802594 RepID=A0A1G1W6U6_9BACT|nr:MAG: hypothetical protein A2Y57_00120 [Candidatus Woykebacteria bacterium RBG_13_40_7b]